MTEDKENLWIIIGLLVLAAWLHVCFILFSYIGLFNDDAQERVEIFRISEPQT
jgi:hypothetical protein